MKAAAMIFVGVCQSIACLSQVDSLYEISEGAQFIIANVHLYPQVAVPSHYLKEAVKNDRGNLGIGFAAGVAVNPFLDHKPSPVLLGFDFGYLNYGVNKISGTNDHPPVKTSFNVYSINAMARILIQSRRRVVPFIDGMAGIKVFNARTKIDKDVFDVVLDEEQSEVLDSRNDTGLNYSFGFGFFSRSKKAKRSQQETAGSFSMRVLYVLGDEATYIKRESITVTPDLLVSYKTGTTRTDMVLIQFGVMLF